MLKYYSIINNKEDIIMTSFKDLRDPSWFRENDLFREAGSVEEADSVDEADLVEEPGPEQLINAPGQIEAYEELRPFDDGSDISFFAAPVRSNFWTYNSAPMTDKPEKLDDYGETALTYAIQNAPLLTKCILQKNKDVLLQTPNQDGLSPIAVAAYMCSPDVCSLDSHDYESNFSLLRYLIEQESVNINQPSQLEKPEDIPNISSQKNLYDNYCDQPITALDFIDFIFANKKLEVIDDNADPDQLDEEDRHQLVELDRQQIQLSDYLLNKGAERKITMPADLGIPYLPPSQGQNDRQEMSITAPRF